jgi:hypothetical protein
VVLMDMEPGRRQRPPEPAVGGLVGEQARSRKAPRDPRTKRGARTKGETKVEALLCAEGRAQTFRSPTKPGVTFLCRRRPETRRVGGSHDRGATTSALLPVQAEFQAGEDE